NGDPGMNRAAPPGPGPLSVALRFIGFVAVVLAATWAAHLIRDALDLTIMPDNEQQVHRALMMGTFAYILLLAMPFVPGVEIGLAMLAAFGAAIAPLVYGATLASMMLAYAFGRLLPIAMLQRLLAFLRMRRAADLVARAAPLAHEDRLSMLLDGASPRILTLAVRHRYLALALLVNTPGNAVIGGGGGIMLLAGISGIFAPVPTLLTLAVAVSPVPLAVIFLGA
ncbi:MAG TPA: hypothetical protein VLA45_18000, partial [Paracoccaceae bacterium]|nr:hypothetical protein [Paracoccaceae bacterium]